MLLCQALLSVHRILTMLAVWLWKFSCLVLKREQPDRKSKLLCSSTATSALDMASDDSLIDESEREAEPEYQVAYEYQLLESASSFFFLEQFFWLWLPEVAAHSLAPFIEQ